MQSFPVLVRSECGEWRCQLIWRVTQRAPQQRCSQQCQSLGDERCYICAPSINPNPVGMVTALEPRFLSCEMKITHWCALQGCREGRRTVWQMATFLQSLCWARCILQPSALVGFAMRWGGVGVCITHARRSLGMKALSCSAPVPPMRSGYRCHLFPDWRRQESGLLSTHFCPNYLIYSEHQMPQSFMAPCKAGIWWDAGLLIGTNLSPSPPGYRQKDSDKGPFDVGEAQTVLLGSLCCTSASLGFAHRGLRATAPGWAPRGTAPNFG